MTHRAPAGRRVLRAAVWALAPALLVAACGGTDRVVPAGSAGLEAPAPAATPAVGAGRATDNSASAAPAASASAVPKVSVAAHSLTPPPVLPLLDTGPRALAPAPVAAPPPRRAAKVAAVAERKPTGVVLPPLGSYVYTMTGTTSVGPPPSTMTLTIADAGGGQQRWTEDARRDDGSGFVEELTLAHQSDGMYLSGFRFDVSTGLTRLSLMFTPKAAVLLAPDEGPPGRAWSFDLESTDGCATAHTDGAVISDGTEGGASALRHLRLTTTLKSAPLATCPALSARRVQDLYHPLSTFLPSRLDSDLSATLTGVPVKANTQATLTHPPAVAPARRESLR